MITWFSVIITGLAYHQWWHSSFCEKWRYCVNYKVLQIFFCLPKTTILNRAFRWLGQHSKWIIALHLLTCSIKSELSVCQSIGKIPDSCRKSVIFEKTICFVDPKPTPIIKGRFRLSPNITFIPIFVLLPICTNLHLHFWAHCSSFLLFDLRRKYSILFAL